MLHNENQIIDDSSHLGYNVAYTIKIYVGEF